MVALVGSAKVLSQVASLVHSFSFLPPSVCCSGIVATSVLNRLNSTMSTSSQMFPHRRRPSSVVPIRLRSPLRLSSDLNMSEAKQLSGTTNMARSFTITHRYRQGVNLRTAQSRVIHSQILNQFRRRQAARSRRTLSPLLLSHMDR